MTAVATRRRAPMKPLARREARQGLLFISPWLIGFLAFTALPMLATLAFTFTNLTLSQEEPLRFVGFENYADLAADAQAWDSLWVTLRFAVLWLPVVVILPLAIALLLNSSSMRGSAMFRVLFFLPYVVPFVAGVLIWQTMLGETGWINGGLSLMGVSDPPSWLNDTTWIHPALVIMGLWGIGAGIIVNTGGAAGNPHGALRRGEDRRGRLVGAAALRDPADDVAGHLLHTHPRSRRGDAVLPRPPSHQQRDRGAGRLDPLLQPLPVQDVLHLSGDGIRRHAGVAPFRGDPGGDVPPVQVVPPVGVLRRRTVS